MELGVIRQISDNRDEVKYKVASGGQTGVFPVVPHLIDTIQSAIERKTSNQTIKKRAGSYKEWWLVVTDPHYARSLNNGDELKTVANAIDYGEPWRRILLAIIVEDRLARVVDLSESRQNAGTTDAA